MHWLAKLPWVVTSCLFLGPRLGTLTSAVTTSTVFPLHVAGRSLRGPEGQVPWFRGVNVNALVAYNPHFPEAVGIHARDFAEMHALGFNLVRLPLSLSRLEPRPGQFSQAYLTAISQVVGWASANGIWVILDLHQDRYAASLYPGEADGFPSWMVKTFGLKTTPILGDITDPAVQGAFTSFWLDRPVDGHGLQYYYDLALKQLASKFAQNPAVAGYDVMNEPNPGFFPPLSFAATVLFPFYHRAVAAIRSVSSSQPIFLEPDVVSMMVGYQSWPQRRWLRQGIVFEPHLYTGTYRGLNLSHFLSTLGANLATPMVRANLTPWNGTLASLTIAYRKAQGLASREDVPWLVGEFGDSPTAGGNAWLKDEIRLQNRYAVGGLLWLWQIRSGSYPWGLVEADGTFGADPERAQIMASPHPLTVGGMAMKSRFQFSNRVYTFQYRALKSQGATAVYLSGLTYPNGFHLTVSPGNLRVTQSVQTFKNSELNLPATRLTIPATNGIVQISITPADYTARGSAFSFLGVPHRVEKSLRSKALRRP